MSSLPGHLDIASDHAAHDQATAPSESRLLSRRAPAADQSVLRPRRPTIAIVDDDPAFAAYLRTFLAVRGYDARCFFRGDEILAAIRQGEKPDVVLLDIMMPGLDGMATLRALKSSWPDLQAIILSGRGQASTIVEAVRLGAADYVIKPDDPEGLGEIALEAAIKNALERTRLVHELASLRRDTGDAHDPGLHFWADSEKMRPVLALVEQVADSDVTVLIRGESGVGKELVARALHLLSGRRNGPFVKVNCAALPGELLESELFGHEKGAFTGALTTRVGKFEQAHGGTILLDEIAEMRAPLQAKLLHVLQDGEFTRLGSNKRVSVDVRMLAATNRDLEGMMRRGEFREDLYYRLKVIETVVPPLRERPDEIERLTDFFLVRHARKYNRPIRAASERLRQLFREYSWPGNVRELENMIKRIVILQDEEFVARELCRPPAGESVTPPPPSPPPAVPAESDRETRQMPPADAPTLPHVARTAALKAEREVIERTLEAVHWNRRKAARLLGVSYKTLLNKIKECGISR